MAEHLGAHPEVFMCPLKEPQYFGGDQHHIGHGRRTLEEYLALFEGAGDAARVGDASTNYLYSRSAAGEIAAFAPDASIIVMLRDPVEIMYAYHSTMMLSGFEPIREFADALAAEPLRRRGRCLPKRSGIRECLYYRDIADLAPHVTRYLETFGPDRVRVIVFEEWRSRAELTYRDTLAFLGVDPNFLPELSLVNVNRRIRNNRAHDLVLDPPRPLQWAARRLLPLGIRYPVSRRLLALNTRAANREAMEPGLLQELRAEFAPKIDELARLIGRDLSAWKKPAAEPHVTGNAVSSG